MNAGKGGTVAARRAGKRRKHGWLKWAAGAVLLAFLVLGVAITVAIRRAEPMLRAAIVEKLEEHFHAHVELGQLSRLPEKRVMGRGQRAAHLAAGKHRGRGCSGLEWRASSASRSSSWMTSGFMPRCITSQANRSGFQWCSLTGLDVDIPAKPHFKPEETEPQRRSAGQEPQFDAELRGGQHRLQKRAFDDRNQQAGKAPAGVRHRPRAIDPRKPGQSDALRCATDQPAAGRNDRHFGQPGPVGG